MARNNEQRRAIKISEVRDVDARKAKLPIGIGCRAVLRSLIQFSPILFRLDFGLATAANRASKLP